MKFKVGDKVRVTKNTTTDVKSMHELVGKKLTIKHSYEVCGTVAYGFVEVDYEFYERDLADVVSLPINITFKNKYEHQAMQQFLFDNGCGWINSGQKIVDAGSNPIKVRDGKVMSNQSLGYIYEENKNYPTFTFNDLDTIKEILNPSKPITELKLNADYTAIIDPNTNTVKVGCQTFTFAKIKELASKL